MNQLPGPKPKPKPKRTASRRGPLGVFKIPRKDEDSHLWADCLEFLCACSPDGYAGGEDLLKLVRESNDFSPDGDADSPAEATEAEATEMAGWFSHVDYRAKSFGSKYPFRVSGSALSLKKGLTKIQRLYLFFLISSSLRSLMPATLQAFTKKFEELSQDAFRNLMPEGSIVEPFHRSSRYRGNLPNKIRKLAGDLRDACEVRDGDFAATDSGDGGIDLVGFYPFEDDTSHHLVMFGQCACSAVEWLKKQSSSEAAGWSSCIKFSVRPSNVVLIPFCYRRTDGSWHNRAKLRENVLLDRLRLLVLLSRRKSALNAGKSGKKVQEALDLVDKVLVAGAKATA